MSAVDFAPTGLRLIAQDRRVLAATLGHDACPLYTTMAYSGPKVCQAVAKSIVRRKPIQMHSGPAGRSLARLLCPPNSATSRIISDSVGGDDGNDCFFTTRHTDFHSASSNIAVQGKSGHSRFKYVRYTMRQAMML